MARSGPAYRTDECPLVKRPDIETARPTVSGWPVAVLDQDQEPQAPGDVASHGNKMVDHPQKITFAEMRAAGVRRVLIYCRDFRCSHLNVVPDDADRWPDELRISDIEDKFVCSACGKRGADIRPDWQSVAPIFSRRKAAR
jgi:hypothetical protein